MLIKGNTITDSQDVSEHFKNFFNSIRQDLQKNIAPTKKKDLKVPNTGIFYISPATPEEISELKKTLRKVKA